MRGLAPALRALPNLRALRLGGVRLRAHVLRKLAPLLQGVEELDVDVPPPAALGACLPRLRALAASSFDGNPLALPIDRLTRLELTGDAATPSGLLGSGFVEQLSKPGAQPQPPPWPQLRELRGLRLDESGFAALPALAAGMPQLRVLAMYALGKVPAALPPGAVLPSVTHCALQLGESNWWGLHRLLPSLRNLVVGAQIPDGAAPVEIDFASVGLAGLTALTALALGAPLWADMPEAWHAIAALPALRRLSVSCEAQGDFEELLWSLPETLEALTLTLWWPRCDTGAAPAAERRAADAARAVGSLPFLAELTSLQVLERVAEICDPDDNFMAAWGLEEPAPPERARAPRAPIARPGALVEPLLEFSRRLRRFVFAPALVDVHALRRLVGAHPSLELLAADAPPRAPARQVAALRERAAARGIEIAPAPARWTFPSWGDEHVAWAYPLPRSLGAPLPPHPDAPDEHEEGWALDPYTNR